MLARAAQPPPPILAVRQTTDNLTEAASTPVYHFQWPDALAERLCDLRASATMWAVVSYVGRMMRWKERPVVISLTQFQSALHASKQSIADAIAQLVGAGILYEEISLNRQERCYALLDLSATGDQQHSTSPAIPLLGNVHYSPPTGVLNSRTVTTSYYKRARAPQVQEDTVLNSRTGQDSLGRGEPVLNSGTVLGTEAARTEAPTTRYYFQWPDALSERLYSVRASAAMWAVVSYVGRQTRWNLRPIQISLTAFQQGIGYSKQSIADAIAQLVGVGILYEEVSPNKQERCYALLDLSTPATQESVDGHVIALLGNAAYRPREGILNSRTVITSYYKRMHPSKTEEGTVLNSRRVGPKIKDRALLNSRTVEKQDVSSGAAPAVSLDSIDLGKITTITPNGVAAPQAHQVNSSVVALASPPPPLETMDQVPLFPVIDTGKLPARLGIPQSGQAGIEDPEGATLLGDREGIPPARTDAEMRYRLQEICAPSEAQPEADVALAEKRAELRAQRARIRKIERARLGGAYTRKLRAQVDVQEEELVRETHSSQEEASSDDGQGFVPAGGISAMDVDPPQGVGMAGAASLVAREQRYGDQTDPAETEAQVHLALWRQEIVQAQTIERDACLAQEAAREALERAEHGYGSGRDQLAEAFHEASETYTSARRRREAVQMTVRLVEEGFSRDEAIKCALECYLHLRQGQEEAESTQAPAWEEDAAGLPAWPLLTKVQWNRALFGRFCTLWGWSTKTLNEEARGRLNRAVRILRQARLRPEYVTLFVTWWKRQYGWRQNPLPWDLTASVDDFYTWQEQNQQWDPLPDPSVPAATDAFPTPTGAKAAPEEGQMQSQLSSGDLSLEEMVDNSHWIAQLCRCVPDVEGARDGSKTRNVQMLWGFVRDALWPGLNIARRQHLGALIPAWHPANPRELVLLSSTSYTIRFIEAVLLDEINAQVRKLLGRFFDQARPVFVPQAMIEQVLAQEGKD